MARRCPFFLFQCASALLVSHLKRLVCCRLKVQAAAVALRLQQSFWPKRKCGKSKTSQHGLCEIQ